MTVRHLPGQRRRDRPGSRGHTICDGRARGQGSSSPGNEARPSSTGRPVARWLPIPLGCSVRVQSKRAPDRDRRRRWRRARVVAVRRAAPPVPRTEAEPHLRRWLQPAEQAPRNGEQRRRGTRLQPKHWYPRVDDAAARDAGTASSLRFQRGLRDHSEPRQDREDVEGRHRRPARAIRRARGDGHRRDPDPGRHARDCERRRNGPNLGRSAPAAARPSTFDARPSGRPGPARIDRGLDGDPHAERARSDARGPHGRGALGRGLPRRL